MASNLLALHETTIPTAAYLPPPPPLNIKTAFFPLRKTVRYFYSEYYISSRKYSTRKHNEMKV